MDALKTKVVREPRRQLHKQPAWMTMDDGLTNRECFVLDVSPGGARIVTDVAIDVRDKFGLALVRDRPKHQSCEVVWRRGKTYGVKFLSTGKTVTGPINDLSTVEPHAQADLFDTAQRVKAEA
ncbi:PilZ domain-containing protein [Bradyrhizobium sp. JYMT SZCCT0428]|uniref:PilZ domain-containing protein n=1 Tax=Bradyrhizobium sp. JYMT SZCCT0428 TaxID=2807673 RepID=UPI002012AF58|nr:PilZ domain-containing protein [Bradyrhizobium sp. JYMT SZCCT0428]